MGFHRFRLGDGWSVPSAQIYWGRQDPPTSTWVLSSPASSFPRQCCNLQQPKCRPIYIALVSHAPVEDHSDFHGHYRFCLQLVGLHSNILPGLKSLPDPDLDWCLCLLCFSSYKPNRAKLLNTKIIINIVDHRSRIDLIAIGLSASHTVIFTINSMAGTQGSEEIFKRRR